MRWVIAVSIAAVLVTFLIDTDWEVSHEVTIDADTAIVWSLLVDIERYAEWNKYSPKWQGELQKGR